MESVRAADHRGEAIPVLVEEARIASRGAPQHTDAVVAHGLVLVEGVLREEVAQAVILQCWLDKAIQLRRFLWGEHTLCGSYVHVNLHFPSLGVALLMAIR